MRTAFITIICCFTVGLAWATLSQHLMKLSLIAGMSAISLISFLITIVAFLPLVFFVVAPVLIVRIKQSSTTEVNFIVDR